MEHAISFGLGVVFMFLISKQTIAMSDRNKVATFFWTGIAGGVWGYMVYLMSNDIATVPAYAIGNAVGALLGVIISVKATE